MRRAVRRALALRQTVRFRWWAAKTRWRLGRAGCDVTIAAPEGAMWTTAPVIEVTRQFDQDGQSRGSLRIELGSAVHLGDRTTIEVIPTVDNVLKLGEGFTAGAAVRLLLFGGEITIGPWGHVRDGAMLKSSGQLRCGHHVIVSYYSILHCAKSIALEDWAGLAERVSVVDSDHLVDGSETYHQYQPVAFDPVSIGRNTWIGANSILLRGAQIGQNSVVAAGSVVRGGDYPDGWVVAGVPAKAKRPLTRSESS